MPSFDSGSLPQVLCVATAGAGSRDAVRVRRLTAGLAAQCTYHDFDRTASRADNARVLWKQLRSRRWDLVYQEGTSIAGGGPLIRAARAWGQPYVVSSGDPVGEFFGVTRGPLWGWAFEQYERLLYRHCTGFIGWTPYLTGLAMKMGAPRAATVEGAVDLELFTPGTISERRAAKRRYGLDPDHLVCGVVGSLKWTPRQKYCYGLELVEMMSRLQRTDVSVLIVGDGDGRARLEARVPEPLRERVVFTGRVPEREVAQALQALDVGFITQTLDSLGRYRLTTKLPEYLAAGVAVAMSPVPGFYDYVRPAGWPLPAAHPAGEDFFEEVATWVETLSDREVEARRRQAPRLARSFGYEPLKERFAVFMHTLLQEGRPPERAPSEGPRTPGRAEASRHRRVGRGLSTGKAAPSPSVSVL